MKHAKGDSVLFFFEPLFQRLTCFTIHSKKTSVFSRRKQINEGDVYIGKHPEMCLHILKDETCTTVSVSNLNNRRFVFYYYLRMYKALCVWLFNSKGKIREQTYPFTYSLREFTSVPVSSRWIQKKYSVGSFT